MKRTYLFWLFIVLIVFLLYSNTFSVPFVLDDLTSVAGNPTIKQIGNLGKIYQSAPLRFWGNFSFALNYYLGGLNVFGFHLVNLIIHILNGFLVFWFVSLLIKSPGLKDKPYIENPLFPLFVSLLFLVHPIQTQAVTYIVQRYASLATFFYLLSLTLYTKSAFIRKEGKFFLIQPGFLFYLFASLLAALSAMFTKEISFTLPLAIFLVEIFFFSTSFKKISSSFPFILLFFLLVFLTNTIARPGVGIVETVKHLPTTATDIPTAAQEVQITRQEYLLTQINVVRSYIRLLFLPINQNFDYDYPLSKSFGELPTLASFLFHVLILIFAFLIVKKDRLISFGIIFFYLALSVESSLIPLADVIFEHRLYLPSLGFAIAVVAAVFWIFRDKAKIYLIFIMLVLSFLTYQRNNVWHSEISLWSDVVTKSPNKERPRIHLGVALAKKGDFTQAISEFEKAAEISPNSINAYNNLGSAYGNIPGENLENLEKAFSYYQKALALDSKNIYARNNLGVVYIRQGKIKEAVSLYQQIISERKDNAETHFYLGSIYLSEEKYDEATTFFQKTIELNPDFANAHYYLGVIYERKEEFDLAIEEYKKALRANPSHLEAASHLGRIR